jgi:hypothetical protein
MSHIVEINRTVERAKMERASYIGSAVQAHAVPVVLVARLSLMLLQFAGKPLAQPTEGAQVAQVTASARRAPPSFFLSLSGSTGPALKYIARAVSPHMYAAAEAGALVERATFETGPAWNQPQCRCNG